MPFLKTNPIVYGCYDETGESTARITIAVVAVRKKGRARF
jgi:hypothetical protein